MPGLGGRVIACLEARYAAELADLVSRHGGISYPAPCLREVHEPDAAEARLAVELICSSTIQCIAFLTGVGVQTIVEAAHRLQQDHQLLEGLAARRIAVRGPKTLNALRRLGVRVDVIAPEPFTSGALLDAIAGQWDIHGETVLVQRYGAPVPAFVAGLRELGAEVVEVAPYRWERPQDEEAVVRLIEDLAAGWIDVLAATSAAQVDHLFDIARERGHELALRRALTTSKLRVAAQGVVCASAFERRGVAVDLIPSRASMGALVLEIAGDVDWRPPASVVQAIGGTVAVFAADDVHMRDVRRVVNALSADTSITVLDGKRRRGEQLVEQASIERALSVQWIRPADDMVRRASQVLIFTGAARSLDTGRWLRLAERYAKPVQVIDTS